VRKRRRIKMNETVPLNDEALVVRGEQSEARIVAATSMTGLGAETLTGGVMTIDLVAHRRLVEMMPAEGGIALELGIVKSVHTIAEDLGRRLASVVPVRNPTGQGVPVRIAVHRLTAALIFLAGMAPTFRMSNYFCSRKSRENLLAGFNEPS
jgi:hypothetical protein